MFDGKDGARRQGNEYLRLVRSVRRGNDRGLGTFIWGFARLFEGAFDIFILVQYFSLLLWHIIELEHS